jgi:hypothetical protein
MLYKIGQMLRGFLGGGRRAGHGASTPTAATMPRRRSGGIVGRVRRLLR